MLCNSLRLTLSAAFAAGVFGFAAPAAAQDGCEPVLAAETTAGAMVRVSLSSTCHAGQSVIIHHNGMMLSDILDDAGMLMLAIPALTESALFMAEMQDGMVAVASSEVPSLSFYDRVALQWQGDAGFELHAREFEGDYMSDDHVWREAARSMDRAALGEGGFLVPLGHSAIENGHRVEVYTFPSATVSRQGDVLMSVEAVVGAENCDRDVSAQAIQVKSDGDLVVRELSMTMPSCDSDGDVLIFGALVDDIVSGSN